MKRSMVMSTVAVLVGLACSAWVYAQRPLRPAPKPPTGDQVQPADRPVLPDNPAGDQGGNRGGRHGNHGNRGGPGGFGGGAPIQMQLPPGFGGMGTTFMGPGGFQSAMMNPGAVDVIQFINLLGELNLSADFTLTADQKKSIQTARDEYKKSVEEYTTAHKDESTTAFRAMMEAARTGKRDQIEQEQNKIKDLAAKAPQGKDLIEKIKAVLTEEQKAKIEEVIKQRKEEQEKQQKEMQKRWGDMRNQWGNRGGRGDAPGTPAPAAPGTPAPGAPDNVVPTPPAPPAPAPAQPEKK